MTRTMISTDTNLFFFLIAGIAIGITGDAGVRATAQQPRMFVGMVIITILLDLL